MDFATLLASFGVGLLLLAFFLDTFDFITDKSWAFILMNIVGASIACYASFLIQFIPFVILEGTWAAVALTALVRKFLSPHSTGNTVERNR